ncbi:MAG: helix-hairpin-helix domain-containing protein [Bacteroidales bacterium]|nr:helix-hairpin-helix domain-containing protein [Bacteroidales bacterium]
MEDRELLISRIELIAEQTEGELDYTELFEDLFYFLENPLNLNFAPYEQFQRIFFLSDFQIHKIIEYRNIYGPFASIYELQTVEGFDQSLIELLEPFVIVSAEQSKAKLDMKDVLKYGRHDLFLRYSRVLQQQAGYADLSDSAKAAKPNSYFLGSQDKYYMRYGFNYFNRIRVGLTAEKDAGEEFFKGSQPQGFDFYSGFAYMSDLGIVNEVVVGDYQLEFGQGLTLWSGLYFGKSPDAGSLVRNQRRLRPSTSVDENRYMRGTAATVGLGNFKITGFYSSKKIDGNMGEVDTVSQEIQFVTSIQETGYHRTNAEMANRKIIGETLYGGNIVFRKNKFQVGATTYKTSLDKPLTLPDQLYRKFNFQGTDNLNYGLDVNFIVNRFNVFGEISGSENGGMAYLAGFHAPLHPSVSLSFFYRNYGIDYQNLYSNAFGESSANQNERGIYSGILVYLHRNWTFRGYSDMFYSPWLRYRIDFPSRGHEYLAQLDYHPNRKMEMYLRYRFKQKQLNETTDPNMIKAGETIKESFRFHASYAAMRQLLLKSRIEFLRYKLPDRGFQDGFLIYQDVQYQPDNKPFTVTLRYALFDTDSYDERIYAYENDVLYAFSIPAYYYKGSRFYILMKYEISEKIDLWLRFAQTYYGNKTTISSGITEIDGNIQSEVKVQMRIKL